VSINFQYEELFFENDGIRLHAVAAGPKLGPVVVLLHRFPLPVRLAQPNWTVSLVVLAGAAGEAPTEFTATTAPLRRTIEFERWK
jgi:pimeloyl-ACP methyl ester carboxylesterase